MLSFAAFAGLSTTVLSQTQPVPPSALDLLDRYDRGDRDVVVHVFESVRDVDELRKDLEVKGPTWTTAGSADREPQRRLVAATMALEFGNARLEDEWVTLRSLVEWGCALLRRGPPS
jgi:hypothetical protein